MFKFSRQIIHEKNAYHADKNKRRRTIIIKDTLYVYTAYAITILATLLARYIDLMRMPYGILVYIFLWISGITGIIITVVLAKQIISARFARALYSAQFVIWLITYTYWIYHLGTMRYVGLLFALMAMVFLIPNSNLFESYLLASSIAILQLAVSSFAIFFMQQAGSFTRDAFFVLCFFPVALFISFIAGQYSRQREKAREAQLQAESTRDVLWKVIRKTADASENTLHDSLYLVNLIFEYCGAEGGCLFALDPTEQRLDLVFSKMEKNSRDISTIIGSAEKALEMNQSGLYTDGAFSQGEEGPAANDDTLFSIAFTPAHGSIGVCCLMKAHMIGTVSEEEMTVIRSILSRSVEVLSNSPVHTEPSGPGSDDKTVLTSSTVEKIEKAIAYIRDNFTSDISRDGLASHLDISPNYFGRLFTEYTGMKMNDFIIDLRIKEAITLLRETDRQIIDIAYSVGFNNLRTFNRAFNKSICMTPQGYRKSERE